MKDLKKSHWQTAVAGLILISGLIHLNAMQVHFQEARGAGLFFLAIASAQIMWAMLYFKEPSKNHEFMGMVVMAIAPTVLFLLTRTIRAPFSDGPEALDTLGLIIVIFQLSAFGILAYLGTKRKSNQVPRAVAIGVVVGLLVYGGGVAAESVHVLAESDAPHGHDEIEPMDSESPDSTMNGTVNQTEHDEVPHGH